MPLDRFLIHRVSIVREGPVLDGMGQPAFDDYNQPVTSADTIASAVPASIQPKTARELANAAEAGTLVADHTIYLYPLNLTTADAIIHEQGSCPVAIDLPDGRYEVKSVPSAAGAGHHLEVDARLIDSPALSGVGSGGSGGSGS